MLQKDKTKHFLFSYGTLQLKQVQLVSFGRILSGRKDILPGYKLSDLRIRDRSVIELSGATRHLMAVYTGNKNDLVEGTLFEIKKEDLKRSDVYEVSNYRRVMVRLLSGQYCWTYVAS